MSNKEFIKLNPRTSISTGLLIAFTAITLLTLIPNLELQQIKFIQYLLFGIAFLGLSLIGAIAGDRFYSSIPNEPTKLKYIVILSWVLIWIFIIFPEFFNINLFESFK